MIRCLALSVFALFTMIAVAIAGPLNLSDGLALEGHDPVAYFTQGRPMKGNPAFMVKHEGATYHFSSAEHQALFEADPAKYKPQYGGFCAYGMASGYQAPVEVDKFNVIDGKLYLNYNGSVQSKWRKDTGGFITQADANWLKQ